MTVLVTGASGFLGGRLCASLARDGIAFRKLARVPGDAAAVGDLLLPETLRAVCAGIDGIFHCAGHAHADDDAQLHWRINFEGTRNLVRAAGEAGVGRLVFLSSVKAMAEPGEQCVDEDWPGEPATAYGRAKRAAEAEVLAAGEKYGTHVAILRLAMAYGRGGRGNLERLARGVRAGWFPPLPETGNRRSLVHADDAVRAARLVAAAPAARGRTYIVADPRAYSGRQIYDAVRAALGRRPAPWRMPAGLLRLAGRAGDAAGRLVGRELPLNAAAVGRLLDSACYSAARIERELGWRATLGLDDGLREMLNG